MKIRAKADVKHHFYPSLTIRFGFIKPPGEWALYIEGTIWKWRYAASLEGGR